jgi:phosphoribosylformylglycinamidine cyclo-ligase
MNYDRRGVSADKQDVHAAIANLDKGLYTDTFCQLFPDFITGDDNYALAMHADTAGTKTSLAYLYWKETGDLSVWEGIAQDAIVMNLDDLACTGITNNIILSSTIGRNKNLVPAEVLKRLIEGNKNFIDKLKSLGFNIVLAGGETADVGDIVRTIDVGATAFARIKKEDVIHINPKPGDVVIGFESAGQSRYEDKPNSGIGCNGLTFARHEVLKKDYAEKYPESFDPKIEKALVYSGTKSLTDATDNEGFNVGQLLLSPTRTYLPILAEIINKLGKDLHGIVHCTGGGQTKVLRFLKNLHVIKNDLFEVPAVFKMIRQQNEADRDEMFRVFNMGHRIEIYANDKFANEIIDITYSYDIRARVIGFVEKSDRPKISIELPCETLVYES